MQRIASIIQCRYFKALFVRLQRIILELFKESISFSVFLVLHILGFKNNGGKEIASVFFVFSTARSSCQEDAVGSVSESRDEHCYRQHPRDNLLQRPSPRVPPGRLLCQRPLPSLSLIGSQGTQQG